MSFNKAILRQYAQLAAPDTLPRSIYFEHTECTVTIFDAYPKATFHFLLLPRVGASPLSASNLTSLRTLLRSPNVGMDEAGKLLRNMKQDADKVKDMIEEEMVKLYGFKWPVHMGFHAVQSMDHIHLHIISDDMCAPGLKTKKHYNSFHPKLGFFLHISDVLSWFEQDSVEPFFPSMINLDEPTYEKKLKEPLECLHCRKEQMNMPQLKTHLQEHFEILRKKKKTEGKRNRGNVDSSLTRGKPSSSADSRTEGRLEELRSGENDIVDQDEEQPRKKHKNGE